MSGYRLKNLINFKVINLKKRYERTNSSRVVRATII